MLSGWLHWRSLRSKVVYSTGTSSCMVAKTAHLNSKMHHAERHYSRPRMISIVVFWIYSFEFCKMPLFNAGLHWSMQKPLNNYHTPLTLQDLYWSMKTPLSYSWSSTPSRIAGYLCNTPVVVRNRRCSMQKPIILWTYLITSFVVHCRQCWMLLKLL